MSGTGEVVYQRRQSEFTGRPTSIVLESIDKSRHRHQLTCLFHGVLLWAKPLRRQVGPGLRMSMQSRLLSLRMRRLYHPTVFIFHVGPTFVVVCRSPVRCEQRLRPTSEPSEPWSGMQRLLQFPASGLGPKG